MSALAVINSSAQFDPRFVYLIKAWQEMEEQRLPVKIIVQKEFLWWLWDCILRKSDFVNEVL